MFNLFRNRKSWGSWRTAAAGDMRRLLEFLEDREHTAVAFTSRLLNIDGEADASMLNRNSVLIEEQNGSTTGALMLSAEGILCPVLSRTSRTGDLAEAFAAPAFVKKRYLTLMGEGAGVHAVEQLFRSRSSTSLDYYQYRADSTAVPETVRRYSDSRAEIIPVKIYEASPSELERLMPLRREYELEEVVLNPAHYNEVSCRRRFNETIRSEHVFYAELEGRPVATCCINSHGIKWSQIGGVYTEPGLRGRGISAVLMARLARTVAAEGRNLTLFVKTENKAAIRLYLNCGYIKSGDYRISYLASR